MNTKRIAVTAFSVILIAAITAGYFWQSRMTVHAIENNISVVHSIPQELAIQLIKDQIEQSDNITFPPELDTDRRKLFATYSLIEQLRIEHNRQLEVAQANWGKYEGAWFNYAKMPGKFGGDIFSKAQLPVIKERNRLRNNILDSEGYTDEVWEKLTPEEQDSETIRIFGDRHELKNYPTPATSEGLNIIKTLILDDIISEIPPDPIEDFTTYTEVDPGSDISITSDTITCTNFMTRDTDTYVYKDFGVDYFDAIDWLTVAFHDSDSLENYESMGFLGGSNDVDDLYNIPDTAMAVGFYYSGDVLINLRRGSSRKDNYTGAVDTEYNVRVERAAGPSDTITCKVYIGESLEDTLSETSATWQVEWRYAWALNSYNSSTADKYFYGYVKNFDLQEAVPDIYVSPTTRNLGIVSQNGTYWTNTANSTPPSWPLTDSDAYFTVTNNGSMSVDITIMGTNFVGGTNNWTLVHTTPSTNEARWSAWSESGNLTDNVTFTTTESNFISSLGAGNDIDIELRLETGMFDLTEGGSKTGTIILTAGAS